MRVCLLLLFATMSLVADEPRRDRYGDALPEGAISRLGTTRWRYKQVLAFSPDGKWAALKRQEINGGMVLCDAMTGEEKHQLGQSAICWAAVFAPDSKTLVLSAGDAIDLYEVESGKHLREIARLTAAHRIAFSPNGKYFAAGAHEQVRVWETEKWDNLPMRTQKNTHFFALAFSADSKRIAAGNRHGNIYVWEVFSGRDLADLQTHTGEIASLAFVENGTQIVSSCATIGPAAKNQRPLRLWDLKTGKEIERFPALERGIGPLTVEGKTLLSGSVDGTLRTWDIATGKELKAVKNLPCHGNSSGRLLMTADCKQLVSHHWNVIFWDRETGKRTTRYPDAPEAPVAVVGFLPDGKRLWTIEEFAAVRLWEAESGKQLQNWSLETPAEDRIMAADLNAAADRAVTVHMKPDGKRSVHFWKLSPEKGPQHERAWEKPGVDVLRAYLSPDGKLAVLSAQDENLLVLDSATGKELARITQVPGFDLPCVFSPDGRWLAVHAARGILELYAVDGPRLELRQQIQPSGWAMAFSRDSRTLAVAPGNNVIKLYETLTGDLRGMVHAPMSRRVDPHAFHPHGHALLGALHYSDELVFWDLRTEKQFGPWRLGNGYTERLVASPDGKRLAISGKDSTVLIWDLDRPEWKKLEAAPLNAVERSTCWDALSDTDAEVAYTAIRKLAGDPRSVAMLKEKMKPIASADAARLEMLIAKLDSKSFTERSSAEQELEKLGYAAEGALRQALGGQPSLEKRKRIEEILKKLNALTLSLEHRRTLRAIEVLELLRTPDSRAALQAYIKAMPDCLPRREAESALQRIR